MAKDIPVLDINLYPSPMRLTRILPARMSWLLGVSLLAACSPDTVTQPAVASARLSPPSAPLADDGVPPACTDDMVVCDPGDSPTVTYDYYENYFPNMDVSASVGPSGSNSAPDCLPGLTLLHTPATLLPPGEAPLTIESSGWAPIHYGEMASGYGRYDWPSGPNAGYWPSTNPSDSRSAYISSGDARCWLQTFPNGTYIFHHDFYKYNGVRIKYGVKKTSFGGGDGGGGGGGGNCHQEYAYLEVDYGDGTGWHTLWEGYVSVCE